MEDKILKVVYTFFLGIIIALFVGLGINTFYEGPKAPVYTAEDSYPTKSVPEDDPEFIKKQAEQEKAYREYDAQSKVYNRNVSIIALVAAVVFLMGSLLLERRNTVIANGIMLGGVFTLIYSIIRGMVSEDTKFTFIAVTIGLLVVLFLGSRRFAANAAKAKSKKK